MTLPQGKIAVPALVSENSEQKSLHGVEKLSPEKLFEQHPKYQKYIRTQSRLLAKHVRRKRGLCIDSTKQENIVHETMAKELNLPVRIIDSAFQTLYQELEDVMASEGL